MRGIVMFIALIAIVPAFAQPGDTPTKPARAAVDPAKAAEHEKEDIKRHRQIAAAHEAAAKCLESGKQEDVCNAELAKACLGIAYGKFCGMKHPD